MPSGHRHFTIQASGRYAKARDRNIGTQPFRHAPTYCRFPAAFLDKPLQLVILPALDLVFALDQFLAGKPGFFFALVAVIG